MSLAVGSQAVDPSRSHSPQSVLDQAGGGGGGVKGNSDIHHPQGVGCGAGSESPVLTACSAARSGRRKCFVTVRISDREGKRR